MASWTTRENVTFSYVLQYNRVLTLTAKDSLIARILLALLCTIREQPSLKAHAK